MKITIYELLGLVKDDKAPNKIKYDNMIWEYDGDYYRKENNIILEEYCNLTTSLNDEVEILEEEKKIPERLYNYISCGWNGTCKDLKREELYEDLKKIGSKVNEIIDYLKSKGE